MEAIQEADPCLTGTLLRDISGSICKGKRKNMKKCDQCRRFAPNIHQLRGVLNPLSSPWLFAQ